VKKDEASTKKGSDRLSRKMTCLRQGAEPGNAGDIEAVQGSHGTSDFLRETIEQARAIGLPDYDAKAKDMRLARIPGDLAKEIDARRGRVRFNDYLAELVDKALKADGQE
jgi:hypothetical protein